MKIKPMLVATLTAALVATPCAYARSGHGGGGHSGGSHSSGHSGSHAAKGTGGHAKHAVKSKAPSKAKPDGTHSVAGHTDKNGRYIKGHRQTNPNDSKRDNWSSKGNVNPDTGKAGTKDPDK